MKIYTKKGDKGQTSLLTGKRVQKHHPRIEAYGTIDELNSFIGLLLANHFSENDKAILQRVQITLFEVGALLALDEKNPKLGLSEISDSDIQLLELEIDKMTEVLPELKSFIIPGGSQAIAICHVCRTVCRRAERICTKLAETDQVDSEIIIYINRLSDYFFMLARKIAFEQKIEIPVWKKFKTSI